VSYSVTITSTGVSVVTIGIQGPPGGAVIGPNGAIQFNNGGAPGGTANAVTDIDGNAVFAGGLRAATLDGNIRTVIIQTLSTDFVIAPTRDINYEINPGDVDRIITFAAASDGIVVRITNTSDMNLLNISPLAIIAPHDVWDFVSVSGMWRAIPVKITSYLPPQLHTVYSALVGVGAWPYFTSQLPEWSRNNLTLQRLANVPSERALNYYFAQSGSDITGDGSRSNPWKSITWANGLLRTTGLRGSSQFAGTSPDAADIRMAGKDFTIMFWAKYRGSAVKQQIFGKMSASDQTINPEEWGVVADLAGSSGIYMILNSAMPPGSYAFQLNNIFDMNRHLIVAGYDQANNKVFISVDGNVATTSNYAGPVIDGAQLLKLFTHDWDIVGLYLFSSAVGGGGALYDPIFLAHAYNNGHPRHYEEIGPTYRSKIVRAYRLDDGGPIPTITSLVEVTGKAPIVAVSGAQNIAVIVANDPAGGIRLNFNRGDKFVDTAVVGTARNSVTVGDYGVGAIPLFDRFDHIFTSGWINVSGNLWSRAEARAVGWVRETTDISPPFRMIYMQQDSLIHVGTTPYSWYWSGGTLYLNPGVGINPNNVMGGFCACPNDGPGWGVNGAVDNVRFENLRVLGSGLINDNASNYGIIAFYGIDSDKFEFVGSGLEFYYTGYHAFGHITGNSGTTRTSMATFVNCRGGLCSVRGNDQAVYVSYADDGLQETIFLDCTADYGALPSYLWGAVDSNIGTPGTAFIAHSAGVGVPGILIVQGANIPTNGPWHCGIGVFVPSLGARGDIQAIYVG
jgi:hypothetical protein